MQSRFNKVTGWCYWSRTPKLAVYSIILTFYSENSLCRRYESFFFWSLDASLVFDREYCCEVLQNLLFRGDQKNSYFRSSEKKNAQGKLYVCCKLQKLRDLRPEPVILLEIKCSLFWSYPSRRLICLYLQLVSQMKCSKREM